MRHAFIARKLFFATSAALLLATSSFAASITYTLDLSVPGTFKLYASTSAGDNAGLAVFGVPLLGNVLTVDNISPVLQFGSKGAFLGPAGFSFVRSGDSGPALDPFIGGAQDTTNSAAPNNLVFGIGQSAGSFVGSGWTPLFPGTEGAQAWDADTLLAIGTYAGTHPLFNTQSIFLLGNAFTSSSGIGAPSAIIHTRYIAIPESATVSLLGLATIGGVGVFRRRVRASS